jgi:hypothetical protein
MSSIKENVSNAFNKKHPDLHINYIVDYDNDSYIVNATKTPNDIDEYDPFYIVYKSSGEINRYIPQFGDSKFIEACENRRL